MFWVKAKHWSQVAEWKVVSWMERYVTSVRSFHGFWRLRTWVLFVVGKHSLWTGCWSDFVHCFLPKSCCMKSRTLGQAGSTCSGRAEQPLAKLPGLVKRRLGSSFISCHPSFTMTLSGCFIFGKSPHFCDPLLNWEVFCSSDSFIFQIVDLSNILRVINSVRWMTGLGQSALVHCTSN